MVHNFHCQGANMKSVCVITGGGSGMGLETAKILGKDYQVVISGRSAGRLSKAVAHLSNAGVIAHELPCDVSERTSVEDMADAATRIGPISVVINAAGVAPLNGDPKEILRINALGTVHVHNAFLPRMAPGGCLIDIGSTGGYMVHPLLLPRRAYRLSGSDPERFLQKLFSRTRWFPSSVRAGFAYCISKNFVKWYVEADAKRFAESGLRVLSVSPGSFDTEMGMNAKAGTDRLMEFCAIKRYGRVTEIAQLLAYCADARLGYLTGVDILCDGGCVAGIRNDPVGFMRMQMEFANNDV